MSGMSISPEMMSGPLYVTSDKSKPKALRDGDKDITGATYLQGPVQIGTDGAYSSVDATLMIGELQNNQADTPDNALYVKGNTTHEGDYSHTGNMTQTGDYNQTGDCDHTGDSYHDGDFVIQGSFSVLDANGVPVKSFDIQHPTKEGWRLRHACLEGPTADVYVRGRITNKNKIELPDYWFGLVDSRTITVSLTPIGAHQDIAIKRISDNEVHLQSKGGMPIDCFYHIYGERRDVEKLIPEYQGDTPEAYPGDNSQYSVAGYHYDQRG